MRILYGRTTHCSVSPGCSCWTCPGLVSVWCFSSCLLRVGPCTRARWTCSTISSSTTQTFQSLYNWEITASLSKYLFSDIIKRWFSTIEPYFTEPVCTHVHIHTTLNTPPQKKKWRKIDFINIFCMIFRDKWVINLQI